MPNPREAIYDVLASKQQRALEARQRAREEAAWREYQERNEQANATYRGKQR